MKKNFLHFAYVGAIALVGSVCFSACSDDKNDPSNTSEKVAEVKEAIPVNLVLSVSTGNQATTRMTADNVQASANSFRGISDAHFYSFSKKNGTVLDDGKHLAAPATAENLIDFSMLYSTGSITNNAAHSNRILEMSLPIGANTVVFYGKATESAVDNTHTGVTAKGQQGGVTAHYENNLENITFTSEPRISNYAHYKLNQEFFSAIMSRILISALSGDDKNVTGVVSVAKETYPIVSGVAKPEYKVFWADYNKTLSGTPVTANYNMSPYNTSQPMKSLERTMADTYYEFSTIQPNEIRGGASTSIKRVVADLWTSMNKVLAATPTDEAEAVAQRMAKKVRDNITTYFEKKSSSTATEIISDADIQFKDYSSIQTSLRNFYTNIPEGYFSNLSSYDLENFPYSFNVPAGAAELRVIKNDRGDITSEDDEYTFFGYLVDNGGKSSLNTELKTIGYIIELSPSAMAGGKITAQNYIYPAELFYFGNTPIRVTDETLTNDAFPDGVNNWNTGSSTNLWSINGWSVGHVTSSTKSVALKYNINYGTALMKTRIKYGASTLYDNNQYIQARYGREEDDKAIAVNSTSPFVFTGVVIGGQPNKVGWNFIPTSTGDFKYYIYDKDFLGPVTSTTAANEALVPLYSTATDGSNLTAPLYTMLWDNYYPGDEQQPVYVAVEFRNDGPDFWGQDNLVRSGGTFYIIGALKPSAYVETTNTGGYKTGITSWPDAGTSAYPPYNTDGTTIQTTRVFMQDYTTDVTFAIGANSLKHAYMTLPDMRSGQMSLGLSVDISWRSGLVYEDIVLGENNPGY